LILNKYCSAYFVPNRDLSLFREKQTTILSYGKHDVDHKQVNEQQKIKSQIEKELNYTGPIGQNKTN
jgi:hypothetical protein